MSTNSSVDAGVSNFPVDFLSILSSWGIKIDKNWKEADVGFLSMVSHVISKRMDLEIFRDYY